MLLPFFTVIMVAVTVTAFYIDEQLQTDEIIEAVNAAKTTWQAGRNFHPSLKKSYLKNLVGAIMKPLTRSVQDSKGDEDHENDYENVKKSFKFPDLPANFDAREKWKHCISLQEVRDQGSCGSCWAVSTSSAFTDRLCIATNGSFNGHLSAQQLMTCCSECGNGCGGGNSGDAWEFFQSNGLVSGGDYNSKEGCQPYTVPECEHHVSGPRAPCNTTYIDYPTPECQNKCYNKEYKEGSLYNDLHKVNHTFSIMSFIPQIHELMMVLVQKEIFDNGPLTTTFTVYDDFLAYKKGVYKHTTGEEVYGHAVKVIGWGIEEGTPYWLVANSWNSDWGDKGFFKIRRGYNDCHFETIFLGGRPDISKYI